MRAQVRYFHSPDADLAGYVPENPRHAGLLVQIMAGPADGPGEESFDVTVCTPSWLQDWVDQFGPTLGRHYLIVPEFDSDEVQRFLREQVLAVEEGNWEEVAQKLSRLGKWEFEDYRE